ncbi:MAG: c-type cytochrome [Gemmatimonas sp.]
MSIPFPTAVVCRALFVMLVVVAPAFAFGAATGEASVIPLSTHYPIPRTTWDSVFNASQAARGETTYTRTCARCHRATLAGADESPALTGSMFMSGWNGQTLYDLHDRIRTSMPSDTPGTYSRKDIADVIAYMLSFNGFPAGAVELPVDDEALKSILFVATKPPETASTFHRERSRPAVLPARR